MVGFLEEKLQPQGAMVVIEARHLCVEMRGVKKPGALTVTSAIRGIFHQKPVREEFLDLLEATVSRLALVLSPWPHCWRSPPVAPARRHRRSSSSPTRSSGRSYSQWLVGPSRAWRRARRSTATWRCRRRRGARLSSRPSGRRDPTRRAGNPLRELFESARAEADSRFSEAGYAGRRTDRGTIYMLYGAPKARCDFEIAAARASRALEVWTYDADVPAWG